MEVRKIMTKNPACCTPDSTLQEVGHMMEMYDCGCIPVVENHKNNTPIGTITDRDIVIRTFAAEKNPLEMKASDIMTTDIVTVTPETSVEQCRDVMEERQIRRILVVDKSSRCVGIVAQADVVQNESNARQTAEFVRDISRPNDSQSVNTSSSGNRFDLYAVDSSRSQSRELDSERESYRRFSNQNQNHERDFSRHQESYNQSFPTNRKKIKKSHKEESSIFSTESIFPLLLGLGAGAAIQYYLAPARKSHISFVPRDQVTGTVHKSEATPVKITDDTVTKIKIRESRDLNTGPLTSPTSDMDKDSSPEIAKGRGF